jgi:hypothetical protein
MIPTPINRTMVGKARTNQSPAKADATPSVVNTTVKPKTKAREARNVAARASRAPREETGSAEM